MSKKLDEIVEHMKELDKDFYAEFGMSMGDAQYQMLREWALENAVKRKVRYV